MRKLYSPALASLLVLLFSFSGLKGWGQTVVPFTSTGTWLCPAGVTNITVECWGGGGAGGSAKGSTVRATGGGGAGGAYVKSTNISVTPGVTYTVTVGAVATSNASSTVNGNPSWFNTVGTIYAEGGAGGQSVTTTTVALMGAGGIASSASSIGATVFKGGNGYTSADASSTGTSAGGGGSAGTASNGNSATSGTGGAAVTGGGKGGNGPTSGGNVGSAGSNPGGGGGGAWAAASTTQRLGGDGGRGQVTITYTATPTTTSISPTSATAGDATFTLTVNGTNFISGLSTITWNGVSKTTTFVNSTQLTTSIPAADISSAGSATVGVTTTGASNTSNTQTFTINAATGPTISITSPAGLSSSGGTYAFGSQTIGSATSDVTFTISNNGASDLVLTTPFTVSGTNASLFTVSTPASSTVAVGNTTTFTVRFSPVSIGAKTAAITIANNSTGSPSYVVNLTGTGTAKTITVTGVTANNKVYNNTTAATLDVSNAALVGVLAGDVGNVSLATPVGTFASSGVGNNIGVTPSLTLTGSAATNYTLMQPTGLTANITQATQTITFNTLPALTTASSSVNLNSYASTTSGLSLSYNSSNTAVATVSGNTLTIVGAGSTTITASQAGDVNYQTASNVQQTIIVGTSFGTYTFTGTACSVAALAPSSVNSSVTMSQASVTGETCNNNSAVSYSVGGTNWGTSFSSARYIEFTVTPVAGNLISITNLKFDYLRSGAGATTLNFRSSLDNYAADLTTNITVGTTVNSADISLSASFSNKSTAITFRIYGWGGGSTGDLRLDNITLNGSATSLSYTWSGGASGDYTLASNWTPTRSTPTTADILKFSSGGNVAVSNVSSETIGSIDVSSNTNVSMNAGSYTIKTIDGSSGSGISVASGSALNLQNNLAIILNESSTIAGALTIANELAPSVAGKTIIINGTLDATTGVITGVGNFTLSSGATLIVGDAGGFRGTGINPTTGAIQVSGTRSFSSGANYTLNGNATSSGFNNITLSTAGTITGTLTINNGSNTVTMDRGMTLSSLVLSSGTLSTGSNTLSVTSITSNGGILNATGGTLTLTNTSPLTFGATALASSIGTLNINGSAAVTTGSAHTVTGNATINGSGLTLGGDLTVNGTLTFTAGKITTGSYKVIAGTISGAAQGTGWVVGNLQKAVSATTAYSFEVGGATYYSPATFTYTALTTPGNLTVSATPGAYSVSTAGFGIRTDKMVARYWSAAASGGLAGTYDLGLTWNAADNSSLTAAYLKLGKYASSWALPALSGTTTATTIGATNITGYGDFVVGEGCPTATISYSPTTQCNIGTAAVTLTPANDQTGALYSYVANNGGTLSLNTATGAVNLAASTADTYTITYSIPNVGNCGTFSTTATLTVVKASVAPTGLSATASAICNGTSTTLTQTGGSLGTGAYWQWYSDASFTTTVGGQLGSSDASLTISPTATKTYYLRAEGGTAPCSATVAAVGSQTITVSQPSAAPTGLNTTAATVCNGTSVTLTQTGGTLGTGSWKWYSDASFTTLVGSSSSADASLAISPAATATYYLRTEGTGSCTSVGDNSISVTVTVTQPSTAPTALLSTASSAICVGQSATLTQTGGTLGTGSWKWYSDASFSTLVNSSVSADASITVSPTVTTTYYLRSEGGTPCADAGSDAISVTVTVSTVTTWTGAVSANWNTPGNWCGGIVPGSTTDVVIPAVTNPFFSPTITTSADVHNITVSSGASLVVNGTFNVYGDVDNQGGTLNTSGGSLSFDGADLHDVDALTASSVTLNGNGGIRLQGSVTITGSLTLTGGGATGDVDLNGQTLTVGAVNGGDADSYIIASAGSLVMKSLSGTGNFPIGTAASYTPLTITPDGAVAGRDWTVNIVTGVANTWHPDYAVPRTWNISHSGGVFTTNGATLSFTYNASDLTGQLHAGDLLAVYHYKATSPAKWELLGGAQSGSGPYTVSVSGVMNYSPFAIGQADGILPVTMLSFSGKKEAAGNVLRWTTATESNNRGFRIERSANGINFTPVGFVNSLAVGGNSTSVLNYTFTDAAAPQTAWYRLQQMDFDGKQKQSATIQVRSGAIAALSVTAVAPNPAHQNVVVTLEAPARGTVTLTVADLFGRLVAAKTATVDGGANALNFDLSSLPAGTYYLRAMGADGSATEARKLVKR